MVRAERPGQPAAGWSLQKVAKPEATQGRRMFTIAVALAAGVLIARSRCRARNPGHSRSAATMRRCSPAKRARRCHARRR